MKLTGMCFGALCGGMLALGGAVPAIPQAAPPAIPSRDYGFTCPGSFPSDLAVVNCEYTG